jgi:hypothetical protein
MSPHRFLFCNIGWMSLYEGQEGQPDKIVGGGSYVKENERGGEVCNFLKCADGYVYGHVETWKGWTGDEQDGIDRDIKIELLGASPTDPYVDGVTVMWTATDPHGGGRRVVGWYRNARVFRKRQHFTAAPSPQHKLDGIKSYRIRAKRSDVVVVPRDARAIRLGTGKGWMGHAQWWFPHLHESRYSAIKAFIQRVSSFVDGAEVGDPDEREIRTAKNLTKTQKKMLLDARIGQGEFRKSLLREWRGCAVTGCAMPQLLRASHIKAWKLSNNRDRLDRDNGLLLLASLDAAFEHGLISFEDSGHIVISPELTGDARAHLGIKPSMSLRVPPTEARRKFLKHHRHRWRQRLNGN